MASTSTLVSPPSRTTSVQGLYGFAKLDEDIVLVQLISSPAPKMYEAHVFRHNFVSVFSYSHTQTFGSNLLEILENGKSQNPRCWLDEDTATVFAAQDVMTRYIWLKDMLVPRMGMWKPHLSRRADRRSLHGVCSTLATVQ
ncbi:hypothetical protein JB92DRAFT_2825167 [Gautieria morchelliformis]|nr:hypothetical protein JB92DRAFT_2825167 [Gautieria morchelliformis]